MTVEEVARSTRVPANTVRYYARKKLLAPARDPENGYRLFSCSDLVRLRFIRRAKEFGLTLGQIRTVLAAYDRGASPCALIRKLVRTRARQTEDQIAALSALSDRIESALVRWDATPDCEWEPSLVCRLVEVTGDEAASSEARTAVWPPTHGSCAVPA